MLKHTLSVVGALLLQDTMTLPHDPVFSANSKKPGRCGKPLVSDYDKFTLRLFSAQPTPLGYAVETVLAPVALRRCDGQVM